MTNAETGWKKKRRGKRRRERNTEGEARRESVGEQSSETEEMDEGSQCERCRRMLVEPKKCPGRKLLDSGEKYEQEATGIKRGRYSQMVPLGREWCHLCFLL